MLHLQFSRAGRLIFRFCLIACASTCAYAADDVGQLPKPVRQILARHGLPENSLSLYIQEYDASQPLLSINSDTPRTPASVIKLLTTYAGLQLLAPNYTWETSIYFNGKIKNGTLNGDLIIKGGGDPLLVKETFWHLLFTLRNRGLTHINGDLLIDDGLFKPETASPADFDNRPYRVYNTLPHPALLNFRAHQFHFVPMKNKVHIYADPPASNLQIKNRLQLVNGPCRGKHSHINFKVSRQSSLTTVEFKDKYPYRCGSQNLLRAVLTNDDYIFGVFKSLWEGMGGTISGKLGKTSIGASSPFYTVPSKPLREIIVHINKLSNNVMARQLLLTIGKEKFAVGSKIAGRRVISDWLNEIGIPARELVIENGSGLSRKARISARTLAEILRHALNSRYQPEFFASLPLLGMDGTMKKRLSGGKVPPGSARIKTGIINNVRAMAGYVTSKSNKNYILVSLQNHKNIHRGTGTSVQDEILLWLYNKQ